MLFAVILTDKPGYGEVRAANLQAHIEWLERNKDVIPVGGSLRQEPEQVPKGGLWIANAESKAQLDGLLKSDLSTLRACARAMRSCTGLKPMPNARCRSDA